MPPGRRKNPNPIPQRQLSVRIPEALHDRLTAEADARVVGVPLLVKIALEQFLDQLPPIEPRS